MFRDSSVIYIWVRYILCTFHIFISGYVTVIVTKKDFSSHCYGKKIRSEYFLNDRACWVLMFSCGENPFMIVWRRKNNQMANKILGSQAKSYWYKKWWHMMTLYLWLIYFLSQWDSSTAMIKKSVWITRGTKLKNRLHLMTFHQST